MLVIKSEHTAIDWVVGPIRETVTRRSYRKRVKELIAQQGGVDNVRLSDYKKSVNIAVTRQQGQDLAQSIAKEQKANYIYVEKRSEGVLYIRIFDGNVVEDSLFKDISDVELICGVLSEEDSNYIVHTHNVSHSDNVFEYLVKIAGDSEVLQQSSSITDALAFDNTLQFEPLRKAEKRLKKPFLALKVAAIAGLLGLSGLFYYEGQTAKTLEIVYKKVDPFKEYRLKTMNNPQASINLAQIYTLTREIVKGIPDWRIYEIQNSPTTLTFLINPVDTVGSKLEHVHQYANKKGMLVSRIKGQLALSVNAINTPQSMIFESDDDVVRYRTEELLTDIRDKLQRITPFARLTIGETIPFKKHEETSITFELRGASIHELMRIAALINGASLQSTQATGKPQRYPITHMQSALKLNAEGVFEGFIELTVFGMN